MHIFDINGPLMDVLRKLADIIIYNLLFVIFSLPVFTCGAAFAALCHGMQNLAAEEVTDQGVLKTFWNDFKTYFKEATKLWCLVLFLAALIFSALFTRGYMPEALGDFYLVSIYVIVGVAGLGLQFAFPYLVKTNSSMKKSLQTSFLMGVAQFPWTLCSLGITVGFVYITLFLRENAFLYGTFFWVSAGFGVLVYITSFFFLKAYGNIFEESKKDVLKEGKS